MFTVAITEPGKTNIVLDLNQPEVSVGRALDNDIVIASNRASKRHARISASGDRITLTDLNSSNGTFVNGQRVEGSVALGEDDRVMIADTTLQVRPLQLNDDPTKAIELKAPSAFASPSKYK